MSATNVYSYDRMTIYINGVAVIENSVVAVPPFHCPPLPQWGTGYWPEDELRDFRTKVERRLDELRAWTREALLIRSSAARVLRARDPSQRKSGEFRIRVRACGSAWRTTLR